MHSKTFNINNFNVINFDTKYGKNTLRKLPLEKNLILKYIKPGQKFCSYCSLAEWFSNNNLNELKTIYCRT